VTQASNAALALTARTLRKEQSMPSMPERGLGAMSEPLADASSDEDRHSPLLRRHSSEPVFVCVHILYIQHLVCRNQNLSHTHRFAAVPLQLGMCERMRFVTAHEVLNI
jgi:hypothetical protein